MLRHSNIDKSLNVTWFNWYAIKITILVLNLDDNHIVTDYILSSIHHFPLIRHWFLVIIFFKKKTVVIITNKNDRNAEREDQCFLMLHKVFWHRKFRTVTTYKRSESVENGDSLLARQPSWKFELIMGMNDAGKNFLHSIYMHRPLF